MEKNNLSKIDGAEVKKSLNQSDALMGRPVTDLFSCDQLEGDKDASCRVEDLDTIKRHTEDDSQRLECKICLNGDIETVCLPCGHACSCDNCVKSLTHCPICRLFIRGTVKIAW